MIPSNTAIKGFHKRFVRDFNTKCWIWQGRRVRVCGFEAKRLSWFILHKYWPDGRVTNNCSNSKCVNPQHLCLVSLPISDRFWKKVRFQNSGCWRWIGAKSPSGYGIAIDSDLKNRQATHVSWFIKHGTWPSQLMCHTCDNRLCVNPDHLFEGSHLDNAADCIRKGRFASGEASPLAKLTEEQVRNIRDKVSGGRSSQATIGELFGISQQQVSRIARKERWKHAA